MEITRLSCDRFRSNEVRVWLTELDGLQPGESRCAGRRLVLPRRVEGWSLTGLQQRLVKIASQLIKHALYKGLLLAEGPLTRSLCGAMLGLVAGLSSPVT